jgi:hypothetical protein
MVMCPGRQASPADWALSPQIYIKHQRSESYGEWSCGIVKASRLVGVGHAAIESAGLHGNGRM